MNELKVTYNEAKLERDFYFAKLREIEILCQMEEVRDEPVRH
jgi:hypothetical protein